MPQPEWLGYNLVKVAWWSTLVISAHYIAVTKHRHVTTENAVPTHCIGWQRNHTVILSQYTVCIAAYLSSAGFTRNFSWTLTVSCLRPAVELIRSTRIALKLVLMSPDQLEYCKTIRCDGKMCFRHYRNATQQLIICTSIQAAVVVRCSIPTDTL